ncbi:MAG: isochorismatase family cysteine hydrolase [Sphingomonas sp.]
MATMLPDTQAWKTLGPADRNSYRLSGAVVDMRRPTRPERSVALHAQPQDILIDLTRTALVVVDMQNDFCATDGWMGSMGIDFAAGRALIAPINDAVAAMRRCGAPVIWLNWGVRPDRANLSPGTQHPFNPNGEGPGLAGEMTFAGRTYSVLQAGEWGARLLDGLDHEDGDIMIEKHRISGFYDTPLDAILKNHDVSTLLFAGVNADHCVLGTLMDANFHGYDTIMLEDCVATTSPDFCMQATLHNVRFCFGFTTSSAILADAVTA